MGGERERVNIVKVVKSQGPEDMSSHFVNQLQLSPGQVHVHHPIPAGGGRGGHGHDVTGISSPWEVVRPEEGSAPPEVDLGNWEPLAGRDHESWAVLAAAAVDLSEAGDWAVSLHPVDQPQEVLLGDSPADEVVDLRSNPVQRVLDEVLNRVAAEGNGEHVAEVGLHQLGLGLGLLMVMGFALVRVFIQ